MKLKIIFASILVLFFILVIALLMNLREQNKRLKNNFDNLNNNNKELLLTKKEFKEYYKSDFDSLKLAIRGLRVKNITNITKIKNNYIDSTKNVYNSNVISNGVFDISYKDKCFGFKGYFSTLDTSITLLDKYFNNNNTIVNYWQRKKILGLKIGKKLYYQKIISDCNDSIKIERINIKKGLF